MAKNLLLNGMIHAKFATESEMANAIGWSRQRLNKVTTGKKVPDLFELNNMAKALDVSFIDLAQIFLGSESTIVDTRDQIPDPLEWQR